MKACTKCLKEKEMSEFYLNGKYYSGMCKACYSAYQAKRGREVRKIASLIRNEKDDLQSEQYEALAPEGHSIP